MKLSKDYQKEKLTINLYLANIFSLLLIVPIALILVFSYYLLWINDKDAFSSLWKDEIISIGLLVFF